MSTKMTVKTICLLILLCTVQVFSQNIIKNNGFEEEIGAENWRLSNSGQIDNSISFVGQKSASLINDQTVTKYSGWYQTVFVSRPGVTHNFSTWYKAPIFYSGYIQIKIEWYDAKNKYITDSESPMITETCTEWKKFNWKVQVPSNASFGIFWIRLYRGGSVWFDEVYFGVEEEPLLKNLSLDKYIIYEGAQPLKLDFIINSFLNIETSNLKVYIKKPSTGEIIEQELLYDSLSEGLYSYEVDTSIFQIGFYDIIFDICASDDTLIGRLPIRVELRPQVEIIMRSQYFFIDEMQTEIIAKINVEIPNLQEHTFKVVISNNGTIISEEDRLLEHLGENKILIDFYEWPVGTYDVLAQVEAPSGLTLTSSILTMELMDRTSSKEKVVTVSDIKNVRIGNGNELLVNGLPFVANILYGVPAQDFLLVKQQGFNSVSLTPADLESAYRIGLLSLVELSLSGTIDLNYIQQTVEKYKYHPGILMWVLPAGSNQELLVSAYERIKTIDSKHPVAVLLAPETMPGEYLNAFDVIIVSIFPVPNGSVEDVNDRFNHIKQFVSTTKPIIPLLQSFGGIDNWTREPSADEARIMFYLSMNQGASSFGWYTFSNNPYWYLPDSYDLWSYFKKINQELSVLPIALTSGMSSKEIMILNEVTENISVLMREDYQNYYLFIANSNVDGFLVSLAIEDLPGISRGVDLLTNNSIQLIDGKLDLYLDGYDAKVYEIRKPINVSINKAKVTANPIVYNPSLGYCQITSINPQWYSRYQLEIINLSGKVIKQFTGETPGDELLLINWDGNDNNGQQLVNGLYFVRLRITDSEGKLIFSDLTKVLIAR